jgi:hypothetical protein
MPEMKNKAETVAALAAAGYEKGAALINVLDEQALVECVQEGQQVGGFAIWIILGNYKNFIESQAGAE